MCIRNLLLLMVAGLLPLALGCETADDDDAPDPCESASADITLADQHGYAFDGALDISSTELEELSDPLFDWSGLTTDLQTHALDPVDDIDAASVVVFGHLSQEEVMAGLSTNTLDQADVLLFVSYETGDATSCHLSDMTLFGNDIDVEQYFEAAYGGTWLLNLTTGTTPGVGTRMAAFFDPVAGVGLDELHVHDTSTILDFEVDLAALTPFGVPAGETALTVDWSGLTETGQGIEFQPGDIDQVMIGHYPDLTTEDLEVQFLDIELITDEIWRLDIPSGDTADLAGLTGDLPFEGVDSTGTWVLALRCTECANPAPPFLTILEACGD